MRTIRLGSTGSSVKKWQIFLAGRGLFAGVVDGIFDQATDDATREFQRNSRLVDDGIVGNKTFGAAMVLGFRVIRDNDETQAGPNFPPPPDFDPLVGNNVRAAVFGRFAFVSSPLPDNPENITITDGWDRNNIVRVLIPELIGVRGAPRSGNIQFHKLAATQLAALWAEWREAGLLDRVLSFEGSFVPRFIRGSRTTLSNHAFGSAFDINARFNGLGATPALTGNTGSVRELVAIANDHGFYWGGHFKNRPDGMHFEIARVLP
jgi:peptidoglycan hydrolase-like protein with peptidoglycan-binding domain